jgi:hypothetical protein
MLETLGLIPQQKTFFLPPSGKKSVQSHTSQHAGLQGILRPKRKTNLMVLNKTKTGGYFNLHRPTGKSKQSCNNNRTKCLGQHLHAKEASPRSQIGSGHSRPQT